jgi:hypothetical protein
MVVLYHHCQEWLCEEEVHVARPFTSISQEWVVATTPFFLIHQLQLSSDLEHHPSQYDGLHSWQKAVTLAHQILFEMPGGRHA